MADWHIVSCEYPPQVGGVSSYVARVAEGLSRAGQNVHVWCPQAGPRPAIEGTVVHADLGSFRPADLRRAGLKLDTFPAPRRLLVQWVPHGYGYRSMNLWFCLWLRDRARKGDLVDVMVHEPFLSFSGRWTQRAAAAVHRVMTMVLLRAARRVWISTPAWRGMLAPFAPARDLSFEWLPIPSSIEPIDDSAGVAAVRAALSGGAQHVVGHFGLYSRLTADPLKLVMPGLLDRVAGSVVVLIGEGSDRLRREILRDRPDLAERVRATGVLGPDDISRHLQACDLLVQPYPEGVTSRRTSAMAALVHGRALVTTAGSASEPLWKERDAVSLVASGDTDAMVNEAERLLRDRSARTELGDRARALYEERFALRHTVNALLAHTLP